MKKDDEVRSGSLHPPSPSSYWQGWEDGRKALKDVEALIVNTLGDVEDPPPSQLKAYRDGLQVALGYVRMILRDR